MSAQERVLLGTRVVLRLKAHVQVFGSGSVGFLGPLDLFQRHIESVGIPHRRRQHVRQGRRVLLREEVSRRCVCCQCIGTLVAEEQPDAQQTPAARYLQAPQIFPHDRAELKEKVRIPYFFIQS
jgi:hypothetical protein